MTVNHASDLYDYVSVLTVKFVNDSACLEFLLLLFIWEYSLTGTINWYVIIDYIHLDLLRVWLWFGYSPWLCVNFMCLTTFPLISPIYQFNILLSRVGHIHASSFFIIGIFDVITHLTILVKQFFSFSFGIYPDHVCNWITFAR